MLLLFFSSLPTLLLSHTSLTSHLPQEARTNKLKAELETTQLSLTSLSKTVAMLQKDKQQMLEKASQIETANQLEGRS